MVEIALEPSKVINQMPDWETYQQFMSRVTGEGRGLPSIVFNTETGEFERRGICNGGICPTGRQFELPGPRILGDFIQGLADRRLPRRVILNLETGELERTNGSLR